MAYDAKVVSVMIASPSDVVTERDIVRSAIAEWNAINSKQRRAVLLPAGWETHTSPELSGRPQQIINDRIVKDADILVGMFWTRIGSHTGLEISGTVEEIRLHLAAGKPVLLYFSESPVHPSSVVQDQYSKLMDFKAWALTQGLVQNYQTTDEFASMFRRHLPLTINDNQYLAKLLAPPEHSRSESAVYTSLPSIGQLSDDADTILKAACAADGEVLMLQHLSGTFIKAGHTDFSGDTPREAARWKAAIGALLDEGLLEARGYKGEIFHVTHAGYTYAEKRGWIG